MKIFIYILFLSILVKCEHIPKDLNEKNPPNSGPKSQSPQNKSQNPSRQPPKKQDPQNQVNKTQSISPQKPTPNKFPSNTLPQKSSYPSPQNQSYKNKTYSAQNNATQKNQDNKMPKVQKINQTSNGDNKTTINQIQDNNRIENNESNKSTKKNKKESLKAKLKKFLRQEDDLDFYIIIGSFIITILMLIGFGILFYVLKKRRKKFSRLNEENIRDINNLSISVASEPKKYEKIKN